MLFENASGTAALTVLSASIFFSSLILVCSGVLQGLGHVFVPSKYISIGLIFKYACNIMLVQKIGIVGAAIATIGGLDIITVLLVRKLHQKVIIVPFSSIDNTSGSFSSMSDDSKFANLAVYFCGSWT